MDFLERQRELLVLTVAALLLAGGVYARGGQLLGYAPRPGTPTEFLTLAWGGGVPNLLAPVVNGSPLALPLFGLLVVLLALAGMTWAGFPARRLTGLAALLCAPLLLNALAAPARGTLLAAWCGLLWWSARAAAGRGAALAGGLLAGLLAGAHLFFALPLVWLAARQPAGRRGWFLGAGVAAMLLTVLLLPTITTGLRADVTDALRGAAADPAQARDRLEQAWRLQGVAPAAVPELAVKSWWRAISGEPLAWLARSGANVLRLVAPAESDDAYPWTVVRTFDWQLRLLPAWGFFLVLGAIGLRAVTAEQRWQLLPYLLTPLLAAVLFGSTLWWRALLAAPLCYLAARGLLALWSYPARSAALGMALVLVALVHWLPPDYTPESLWRGLALAAAHQPDPERAHSLARAWATRYPDRDEAWWVAQYAALQAGERAQAQHYLVRAMLYAPDDGRREYYVAGLRQLRLEVAQRAGLQRALE